MLEKPNAGWTKVCIGDFIDRASYITDVPVKCLKAFINGYSSNLPIAINFDAEGHEYLLIVDYYETHIITDEDTEYIVNRDYSLISFDVKRNDLAKELINDIESNLEEWVQWDLFIDDGVNSVERREELTQLIEELKALIDKSERRSEESWQTAMDFINSSKQVVQVSSNEELQAHLEKEKNSEVINVYIK